MKTLQIPNDVLAVLKSSTITETTVVLPQSPRLAPSLYKAVNKVLESAGGTWNRGKQAHVFTSDPRERLGLAITTGTAKVDLSVAAPKIKAAAKKKELQAFYTPAALAARAVELADVSGKTVLEPNVGGGALAQACLAARCRYLTVVDIDPAAAGLKLTPEYLIGDFLGMGFGEDFDRIVMNPPFAKGQDIKHVHHAFRFLKPGGRLVAILPPSTITKVAFAKGFPAGLAPTKIEPVPVGTFRESGTDVATVILVIDKPKA